MQAYDLGLGSNEKKPAVERRRRHKNKAFRRRLEEQRQSRSDALKVVAATCGVALVWVFICFQYILRH